MKLTKFFEKRLKYQKMAEKRDLERISMGSGVDDTPYYNKIVEEMMMDLIERMENIEDLLKPVEGETQASGQATLE